MSKDNDTAAPSKKPSKMKKLIVYGLGGVLLIGGGVGAGVYASGAGMVGKKEHEDPRKPKLVVRSDHAKDAGGGGGYAADSKEPPKRVGTVSVMSDNVAVDPQKYEIAYYPIDQAITANLADGGGFAQLGISVATYYDSKVHENLKRQMVPIRSAILMIMSDQQAAVLATPEGKQMLQRQLTKAINQVLREKEGFGGIDNVYFTTLVVQ